MTNIDHTCRHISTWIKPCDCKSKAACNNGSVLIKNGSSLFLSGAYSVHYVAFTWIRLDKSGVYTISNAVSGNQKL